MWGDDLNSSAQGGGFSTSFSQNDGTTSNRKQKRGRKIVPIMIGHIPKSTDQLKIWGEDVHLVTFVGILREIEKLPVKMTYVIEDETGTISCVRFLEAQHDDSDEPSVKLNTYVRVTGYLRMHSGKVTIFIIRIWPIDELNELTNHLLEVTNAMLEYEEISNATQLPSSEDTSMQGVSGLTTEQAAVFKVIKAQSGTESGIEKNQIKESIPKHILPQLESIIEFLASEGHIYSTLTDDHFKAT